MHYRVIIHVLLVVETIGEETVECASGCWCSEFAKRAKVIQYEGEDPEKGGGSYIAYVSSNV